MTRSPRITLQTLRILSALLQDDADHYGLAIAKQVQLPVATVYVVLARLERAGWLRSEWEDIDPVEYERPRRRLYRLTPRGRLEARQARDRAAQSLFPGWQPFPSPGP